MLILIGPALLQAQLTAPRSFAQLVADAPLIVVSTVAARRSAWEHYGASRIIVTTVTLQVESVLKGSAGRELTVEVVGGSIGDETMRVSDTPEFRVGDRDVLFLTGTPHTVSPLIGSNEGRFRVVTEAATGVARVVTGNWVPLTSIDQVGALGVRAPALSLRSGLTLSDFAARVSDAARAGRAR
jgi:hypothetical protein